MVGCSFPEACTNCCDTSIAMVSKNSSAQPEETNIMTIQSTMYERASRFDIWFSDFIVVIDDGER